MPRRGAQPTHGESSPSRNLRVQLSHASDDATRSARRGLLRRPRRHARDAHIPARERPGVSRPEDRHGRRHSACRSARRRASSDGVREQPGLSLDVVAPGRQHDRPGRPRPCRAASARCAATHPEGSDPRGAAPQVAGRRGTRCRRRSRGDGGRRRPRRAVPEQAHMRAVGLPARSVARPQVVVRADDANRLDRTRLEWAGADEPDGRDRRVPVVPRRGRAAARGPSRTARSSRSGPTPR